MLTVAIRRERERGWGSGRCGSPQHTPAYVFFSTFSYVCGTNNAVKAVPQLAPALPVQGQPETDAEVQFAAVFLLLLLLSGQRLSARKLPCPEQRSIALLKQTTTTMRRCLFCLLIAQIFVQALNGELMARKRGRRRGWGTGHSINLNINANLTAMSCAVFCFNLRRLLDRSSDAALRLP